MKARDICPGTGRLVRSGETLFCVCGREWVSQDGAEIVVPIHVENLNRKVPDQHGAALSIASELRVCLDRKLEKQAREVYSSKVLAAGMGIFRRRLYAGIVPAPTGKTGG